MVSIHPQLKCCFLLDEKVPRDAQYLRPIHIFLETTLDEARIVAEWLGRRT